jgi:hypothetical protein
MKIIAVTAALGALAAAAFAVDVGDKAPALKVQKWVYGAPLAPEAADGKTLCVVSFVDLRHPDIKRLAPALNRMLDRYKTGGVAAVALVSDEPPLIEKFVQTWKPAFRVAIDKDQRTESAYGAVTANLPYSYIVGKDGVILWAGRSIVGLTDAVDRILSGKYSIDKARPLAQLRAELQKAIQEEDAERMLKALDQIIKAEPDIYEHISAKAEVLRFRGDMEGIRALRKGALKNLAGSPDALNRLAWDLVTEQDMLLRDPVTALAAAQEAAKLTQRKDAPTLDTLARAYYELCMLEEAVAIQKEAFTVVADEDERKIVKGALDYYEAVRLAREESRKKPAGAPARPPQPQPQQ